MFVSVLQYQAACVTGCHYWRVKGRETGIGTCNKQLGVVMRGSDLRRVVAKPMPSLRLGFFWRQHPSWSLWSSLWTRLPSSDASAAIQMPPQFTWRCPDPLEALPANRSHVEIFVRLAHTFRRAESEKHWACSWARAVERASPRRFFTVQQEPTQVTRNPQDSSRQKPGESRFFPPPSDTSARAAMMRVSRRTGNQPSSECPCAQTVVSKDHFTRTLD